MATEDMSMDVEVSVFLDKTVTSTGYNKKDNKGVISTEQNRNTNINVQE